VNFAEKSRVGRDFQAICPELLQPEKKLPQEMSDRALLVWSPSSEITDEECKSREKVVGNFWGTFYRSAGI